MGELNFADMKIHEMDDAQRKAAWEKFKQMRELHCEFCRHLLNDLLDEVFVSTGIDKPAAFRDALETTQWFLEDECLSQGWFEMQAKEYNWRFKNDLSLVYQHYDTLFE